MKTAAIRGWSLLLSTVPAWRMTAHSVEQSLQVLNNAVTIMTSSMETVLLTNTSRQHDYTSSSTDECSDNDGSRTEIVLLNKWL